MNDDFALLLVKMKSAMSILKLLVDVILQTIPILALQAVDLTREDSRFQHCITLHILDFITVY